MKISKLWLFIFILLGCDDDAPAPIAMSTVDEVIIMNEGNFLAGNGTLDLFNVADSLVNNAVYEASATVQIVRNLNDQYFLVSNAPDRVDVLDSELNRINRIDQGLDNPIDVATVGNQAFVTNWGNIATAFTDNPDSYVAIVNLGTSLVIDSVLLTTRPQRIIAVNELLFIANEGGNTVTVLDPTDLSTQEVTVAAGPSNLIADSSGDIWILCTSGNLMEIDGSDFSTGANISGLTSGGFNEKIALHTNSDKLYFLGGNNTTFTGQTTVYEVDLNTEQVRPLIEGGFAFYGIGVDPETGDIYVGDSNAFQSTGTAFRYDSLGNLIDQFGTGIGPNGFLFK